MSEGYALRPGDRCGAYRLAYPLELGGFSEVHVGVNEVSHKTAAIKVLQTGRGQSDEFQERFELECRLLSRLDHENIVRFYDAGYEAGRIWIAMELLRGRSLRKHIHHEGRPGVEEALRISYEVACGLSQAQSLGIVHRDVKPENIFCTEEGPVKMLDFGIAKATGWGAQSTTRARRGKLGTPSYMSPEQIQGDTPGFPSDVYQLGEVLYEMLSGRHPFAYRNGELPERAQLFELKLGVMPRPLSEGAELGVSEELWQVLERALKKDPRERFATMGAFGQALWDALKAARAEARASGRAYDERNPAASNGEPLGAGARRAYQPARTPPDEPSPALPSGSVRLRSDIAPEAEGEGARPRGRGIMPVPLLFAQTEPSGSRPERTTLLELAPDRGRAPAWLALTNRAPGAPRFGPPPAAPVPVHATLSLEPVSAPPRSGAKGALSALPFVAPQERQSNAERAERMPAWVKMVLTASVSVCATIVAFEMYLRADTQRPMAAKDAPPQGVTALVAPVRSAAPAGLAILPAAPASAALPSAVSAAPAATALAPGEAGRAGAGARTRPPRERVAAPSTTFDDEGPRAKRRGIKDIF